MITRDQKERLKNLLEEIYNVSNISQPRQTQTEQRLNDLEARVRKGEERIAELETDVEYLLSKDYDYNPQPGQQP